MRVHFFRQSKADYWMRANWELQIHLPVFKVPEGYSREAARKTLWLALMKRYDWKWELPRAYSGAEDTWIIVGPFGFWYNGYVPRWFFRHWGKRDE